MSTVGNDMLTSRPDIPLSFFNGNWDNIEKHQAARAVDWMDFLLFVVPTLIIPSLHYPEAREKLKNLIISIHLCLRWELSTSDILFIQKSIDSFQEFLIERIQLETLNRRCFKINIHYLGHIAYMVQRLGPLPSYSCRPLERTIGYYKDRKLSPSLPGTSFQMHIETECSLNHLLAQNVQGRNGVQQTIKFIGKPNQSDSPPDPVTYANLRKATGEHMERLGITFDSNTFITSSKDFYIHQSVQLKNDIYRSLFYLSSKRSNKASSGQPTVLCKADLNHYFFGMVHFYFEVYVNNISHKLVALQVLKDVVHDKTVNGKLFPYWKHQSGHHLRLVVIDVGNVVDAVGIISDSTNKDIKHLVPSKQHIWDFSVLTDFNNVKAHLRRI
ncbi:hypothetical protein [Absidia glauca]|uniref:Uncharacterized protein n=1 Tax=Absidia glauca TaxID=4829 RepID=A0A168QDR0_ABSGL|nr:hypothetical protein [Absidia glauca]